MSGNSHSPGGRLTGRPLGRLVALTGLVSAMLLAFAAPALAQNPGHGGHELGSGDSGSETAAVILRVVLLVISGLVAGIALLRPIARVDNSRIRLVVHVGAGLSAAALLLSAATAGVGLGYAVVQAALTLFIPLLWRRVAPTTVIGALLTLLLAAEAADAHGETPLAIGMVHSAAATIWLAAAALYLAADRDSRSRTLRLLVPVSLGATAALAVTGVVAADNSNLGFDSASAESGFGRIVALKALLLVVVVAIGVALYLRRSGSASSGPASRPMLIRVGSVTLAGALALGATLAAVDPPALSEPAGKLALRPISVGDETVTVAVIAHRPGPNLVHVSSDGYSVGTDPDRLTPAPRRPGANGGWAIVDLPEGESTLYVEKDGERGTLLVDAQGPERTPAGLLGPDGPECASAWLGAAAAQDPRPEPTRCPADALTEGDADSLRAVVRHLQARGAEAVRPVTDGSPRSIAAREVVVQETARAGLRIVDAPAGDAASLVVSGWEPAEPLLAAEAKRGVVGYGTYLAPWLATGPLLKFTTGAISVLRFDPSSLDSRRYLAALRAEEISAQVSPAGFEAWLGRVSDPASEPSVLYAAAMVKIFPTDLGHTHSGEGGWLPGGSFTAVSLPLP